ncbi:phage portal protein [Mycolicibacterium elephantis]|uniref:phage portal protein n=1 Tax=Mycolicibacterium elephantis TaxID=81858 RepID=UPI0007EA42F2|nr:phage portal protein [Mycolicibacterium elephantis]OBB20607.1 phage portal protein [Mycolicibacterium elephantis]
MGFVVSEGTVRGLGRPSIPFRNRIELSPWVTMEYFEIWRTQPAVRRAVTFLARNIAQLGIHLYERRGDTDRQRVTDHDLARLLRRPNPWTTRYRFLNTLVHDFAIYDVAYWWKIKPNALVHLPAPLMTPKGDNWLTPEEFEFRGTKGTQAIPADQVVYFRGYGGVSDAGVSPLESLRQTLREEWTAGEMREQVMRNGARHSGYIQRPKDAPNWSDKARERFKQDWQQQYAGAVAANGGGTALLEDGMTWVSASQTAKELQYIEGRKLTDEEVCRSYFIPPPMIGILDRATFSNIEEQHKMLYADTLGPWLAMFEDEIDLQLLPDLEPVNADRFYTEFNLREKLTGSFQDRAKVLQPAVGGPWMTVNEARALDNRPPVEGGDELIRPLNVTQNGDDEPVEAEPGDESPRPPAADEDDEDEDEQED